MSNKNAIKRLQRLQKQATPVSKSIVYYSDRFGGLTGEELQRQIAIDTARAAAAAPRLGPQFRTEALPHKTKHSAYKPVTKQRPKPEPEVPMEQLEEIPQGWLLTALNVARQSGRSTFTVESLADALAVGEQQQTVRAKQRQFIRQL